MRAALALVALLLGACSPAPEPLGSRVPEPSGTGGTAGSGGTGAEPMAGQGGAPSEPGGAGAGGEPTPEPMAGAGGESGSGTVPEPPEPELGDPCQNSDGCGGDVPVCGPLDYCTLYCDKATSGGFTPDDAAEQRCEAAGGSCVYEPDLRGMCEL